ncbi:MAG: hypothetical protein IKD69_02930 [Solobacterium sp.]|nr:hypothetical protein [Solobacterium sp.]
MYTYEKINRSFLLQSLLTNTNLVSPSDLLRVFCGGEELPSDAADLDVADSMIIIESDTQICLVHDTSGILLDDLGFEEDVYGWYDKEDSFVISRYQKTPVCCLLHTDSASNVYRSIRQCPSGRQVRLFNLTALNDPGLQADKVLYDYAWLLKEVRESIRLLGPTVKAVQEAIQDLPKDGLYTEFLQANAEDYAPFLVRRMQMETAGLEGRKEGFRDGFLQNVLTAAPMQDDKGLVSWLVKACGISQETAEEAVAGYCEKQQRA